ncbi:MAG: type II toxin-antitoxin system Phd/YefM family antitoxin [Candidatus Rokubacteria bacterium]|nr:type II toxin-antitoxin system Phd/YefM family antitoxin [Candidatus Rokubacteria bacterium]
MPAGWTVAGILAAGFGANCAGGGIDLALNSHHIRRELHEEAAVIDLTTDIHPLTAFKRETRKFLEQAKRTGHPLVLTVNGRATLIVQDAASYQRLLRLVERAEAIAGVRAGLEEFGRGQGVPVRHALRAIRRRHAIPR